MGLCGLIPAAGKGTRARPYTHLVPKCMLDINGVPNIQRNISIMRDDLGIQKIIVVVGYLGDVIKNHFGDGSDYGVKIKYVLNSELDKGLSYSILLAKEYIDDYCVVILSDECYINSNHKGLLSFPYNDSLVTCATMMVDDRALIKRNYSVEVEGNKILNLIEKPKIIKNDILGSGTFILSPEFFGLLEDEFKEKDYVEFVSFIDKKCNEGKTILSFNLTGNYVNINDRDSLNLAKYHERSTNFEKNSLSLLIYSEGNEQDLAFTIKRYKTLNFINHFYLIVPHDNEIESIASDLGISVIKCPPEIKLYGEKQKYGMEKAKGDILILCDADYSFPYRDILKLLAYLREADMVTGTRTTRQLIEQGSNMKGIVRIANIWLAKLLEFLWWNFEGRFTDAQCIFRAIWKSNFNQIKNSLNCKGAGFGAEMIIEVLNDRGRIIEIPVNYHNRPKSAYHKYQNPRTFFEILFLIFKKKFQQILKK